MDRVYGHVDDLMPQDAIPLNLAQLTPGTTNNVKAELKGEFARVFGNVAKLKLVKKQFGFSITIESYAGVYCAFDAYYERAHNKGMTDETHSFHITTRDKVGEVFQKLKDVQTFEFKAVGRIDDEIIEDVPNDIAGGVGEDVQAVAKSVYAIDELQAGDRFTFASGAHEFQLRLVKNGNNDALIVMIEGLHGDKYLVPVPEGGLVNESELGAYLMGVEPTSANEPQEPTMFKLGNLKKISS